MNKKRSYSELLLGGGPSKTSIATHLQIDSIIVKNRFARDIKTSGWTSNAEWPDGSVSSDNHSTKEQADGVCKLLMRDGYGGDKKVFPIRVWSEEKQ